MFIERLIGRYDGHKRGPLLILLGAMHGNEPAGYQAIDLMLKMLEVEPITNPEFKFSGRVVGIIGNKNALQKRVRFIERDLNRSWLDENVARIKKSDYQSLKAEDKEIYDILKLVKSEIADYNPDKVFILDVHTTSADGGIFTIVPNEKEAIGIGMELNAPVILGLLEGLAGTTMHYFNEKNLGKPTLSLSFESGNHGDSLSVNRAIAAITNFMKIVGCFDEKHIENRHDILLQEFSKNIPKLNKLCHKHTIKPGDKFKMKPGYSNFQEINEGELLAEDKNGNLYSKCNGRILMPLYQKKGEDGFFIIEEVKDTDDYLNKLNNI